MNARSGAGLRPPTASPCVFFRLSAYGVRRSPPGRTPPQMTPDVWSRRALQDIRRPGFLVLHQCIRPRMGASSVLRATMDISAVDPISADVRPLRCNQPLATDPWPAKIVYPAAIFDGVSPWHNVGRSWIGP